MTKKFETTVEDFIGCTLTELSQQSIRELSFCTYELEACYGEIYGTQKPSKDYIDISKYNKDTTNYKFKARSAAHNYLYSTYSFSQCIEQISEHEFGHPNKVKLGTLQKDLPIPKITRSIKYLLGLRNVIQHGFPDTLTYTQNNDQIFVRSDKSDFYQSRNWSREGSTSPHKYTQYLGSQDKINVLTEINEFHYLVRGIIKQLTQYENNPVTL